MPLNPSAKNDSKVKSEPVQKPQESFRNPISHAGRTHRFFTVLTLFVDIAAILAAFWATYSFRFMTGIIPVKGGGMPEMADYALTLPFIIPTYIWMFRAYGLYQAQRHIRRIEEIFLVIKAVTFAILILTAFTFFYRGLTYSRIYLVVLWGMSILSVSMDIPQSTTR